MSVDILRANQQRWWQALLTGVPYAVYKLATGYYLWNLCGNWFGVCLMMWGLFDFSSNLATMFVTRPTPFCLLAVIGHWLDVRAYLGARQRGESPSSSSVSEAVPALATPFRWEELGLGLDTLASFVLVSYMIWNRHIPDIVPYFGRTWDLAVIANITSVGMSRVLTALDSPRSPLRADHNG